MKKVPYSPCQIVVATISVPELCHITSAMLHIKVHSDYSFFLLMFFLVLAFVFMQVILGMIVVSCVQTACLMASYIQTAVPLNESLFWVLPVFLATQIQYSSTSHCLGSSAWNCSHWRRCRSQSKSTNLIMNSLDAS